MSLKPDKIMVVGEDGVDCFAFAFVNIYEHYSSIFSQQLFLCNVWKCLNKSHSSIIIELQLMSGVLPMKLRI